MNDAIMLIDYAVEKLTGAAIKVIAIYFAVYSIVYIGVKLLDRWHLKGD